jgi:hypothetical protein
MSSPYVVELHQLLYLNLRLSSGKLFHLATPSGIEVINVSFEAKERREGKLYGPLVLFECSKLQGILQAKEN